MLDRLTRFREGILKLGGNFNVKPDPLLDKSQNRPTQSNAFLKHFRKALQTHLLVDSWRAQQTNDKDFSYYSNIHDVYTRINIVYVNQTLELLIDSTIEQITISDQAPVTATLSLL